MKCLVFAAVLLASAPLALAQDVGRERQITIRGCVVPAENDTYVMTGVTQRPGIGGGVLPEIVHGRRVLFWLRNDDSVKNHPNQIVEVTGRFTDLRESEIELKSGRQPSGGLVVEIEGPGRDVRTANRDVAREVGATGRAAGEDDIKTYLAEVRVTHVREVGQACK